VTHDGFMLIRENQKKEKNLDRLFYVKGSERLRFNSLKLIIYLSPINLKYSHYGIK
jgi:hypothetical protein